MLNMALLNIMGGGSSVADVSSVNILGAVSPCVLATQGHFPFIVHIWNKYLTTFICNIKCAQQGIYNDTSVAVVGYSIKYLDSKAELQDFNNSGSFGTKKLWCTYGETDFGFVDTFNFNVKFRELYKANPNIEALEYADYFDYLQPLSQDLTFETALQLADLRGGTPWVSSCDFFYNPIVFQSIMPEKSLKVQATNATVPDGLYAKPIVKKEGWEQKLCIIRGYTSFPTSEKSNQMFLGFMQVEIPQIGYGIAYSFGIAKNQNCTPKYQGDVCGSLRTRIFYGNVEQHVGSIGLGAANLCFPGVVLFNLDSFLRHFKEAGMLNSISDAPGLYKRILDIFMKQDAGDYSKADTPDLSLVDDARFYKSMPFVWDLIDHETLEKPLFDVFKAIASSDSYYMRNLLENYPNIFNFSSVFGCGVSHSRGILKDTMLFAVNDALSVFCAASRYPDTFPVDIAAL